MRGKIEGMPLTDAQRFDWLRLIRSENVGPRTFTTLIDRFGGAGAALKALPDLARRGGAARPIRIATSEEIDREMSAARQIGVRFIAFPEPDYPPALRQIDSAPPILAFRGREEALQQPAVAIVGSRNASAVGLTFSERLARGLGGAGYVIVSGLARGVDQRAHVASLETGTIAVLAGGHARPYPPEAAPLIARICEFGAVISEMPVEWEPRGRDFPRRNRIVSGMALGTVVVEAARNSGSLITARFAAEQNREVFAVPGSPLDPRAEGTNDLLREGANLCARPEDVLGVLEPLRARDPFSVLREEQVVSGTPWRAPFSGGEPDDGDARSLIAGDASQSLRDRILALLGPAPIALDDLARAAEAPISEVRVVLLELDLAGRLDHAGGAHVSLSVARDDGQTPLL